MSIKLKYTINSHNEWDPLEEAIIGNVDGAMFPDWNLINEATVPPNENEMLETPVAERQKPLIKALKGWGFKPIPCSFEGYFPFLGSFHCAALDAHKRGELQSYF